MTPAPALYYVVGASGVGKDSLMRYARSRIGDRLPVVFAHRYITRTPYPDDENFISLSPAEFGMRKQAGAFVLDWASHGLQYAIGAEINFWLAMGLAVVVNGSRGHLLPALDTYPNMTIVWITARSEIIAARLAARGRESAADIAARLERNPAPALPHRACRALRTIDNSGALEVAGEAFVALLSERRLATPGRAARA